ncbi:DUF7848 domain-containing protein [Kitasatospora sp. NPDC001574]
MTSRLAAQPALWTPSATGTLSGPEQADKIVTRFGDWTLAPDDGPDVDPAVYVLVCKAESESGTVCGTESGPVPTTDQMVEWARKHTWAHPDHRSMRLLADVPMVMAPTVEPL